MGKHTGDRRNLCWRHELAMLWLVVTLRERSRHTKALRAIRACPHCEV